MDRVAACERDVLRLRDGVGVIVIVDDAVKLLLMDDGEILLDIESRVLCVVLGVELLVLLPECEGDCEKDMLGCCVMVALDRGVCEAVTVVLREGVVVFTMPVT